MKKICTIIIAICIVLLFNVYVYAEDAFTLSKESVDVRLNGTAYISYTGGSGTVTWSSSDTSVATVDNGTVKGLKIGETTITATRGNEVKTCKVKVVYNMIKIGGNYGTSVNEVNLVLNEHPTENLYATVEDDTYKIVNDAKVTWSSSDTSVVTVDGSTGTITAVKPGKTTITATAAGVTDTCEITVVNGPVFTNFSNAKYELLYDVDVDLKITGVTPNNDNMYYYIITPNNTKPTISKNSYGSLDTEVVTDARYLSVNTEENYIYARNLDKYVELNQDLYLWVIEDVKLGAAYAINEENNYISHSTKFVVEGEKLERPQLPQLNLILKSFYIWGGENSANIEEYTSIHFRFPTAVENRKFKIKIGKVTDNNILQKIQNNDYSGITALLTYAKNNDAVYSADLTTTRENYYNNKNTLFDGLSLLQHKAYYYIYVEFDDENGKYYPIEGVTLGQAWISSTGKSWDLWAYTADNFEWNNLSSTPTDANDGTKTTGKLPNAGSKTFVIISVIILVATTCAICYKKYNWFRDIK